MSAESRPRLGLLLLAFAAMLGLATYFVFTDPAESAVSYVASFLCTIFAALSFAGAIVAFFPSGAIKPQQEPSAPWPPPPDMLG